MQWLFLKATLKWVEVLNFYENLIYRFPNKIVVIYIFSVYFCLEFKNWTFIKMVSCLFCETIRNCNCLWNGHHFTHPFTTIFDENSLSSLKKVWSLLNLEFQFYFQVKYICRMNFLRLIWPDANTRRQQSFMALPTLDRLNMLNIHTMQRNRS